MGDKKKKRVVKDENFFVTFGWMTNPDGLNLSGMQEKLYAIIYGFSQTGRNCYDGSLQYLADWTNSTERSVINNLNALVKKGLLEKIEVAYNKYQYKAVVKKFHDANFDGEKISPDGEKISPNNIDILKTNNSSNKRENKTTQIKHKYGEYQNVLLKDNELKTLVVIYGQEKTDACIKELDEYIEMKGAKYKNHYLVLRKWVFEALKEKRQKNYNSGMITHECNKEELESLYDSLDEE